MLAVYSYYEITIYIKRNYTSFICIDVNLPDIYVCVCVFVCVCVCSYAFAHISVCVYAVMHLPI